MAKRFANLDLLKDIFTPNVAKELTPNSPYYYGMDKDTWRQYADSYHTYLKDNTVDSSKTKLQHIQDDLRVSDQEARAILDYTFDKVNNRNDVFRHVGVGTPHAASSELLIEQALKASGQPVASMNDRNMYATDLEMFMPGPGDQRMMADVQQRFIRPGMDDRDTFAALNKLMPQAGEQVFDAAAGSDTLQTIINEARRRGNKTGRVKSDKLLQSSGQRDVPQDMVKDLLLGPIYRLSDMEGNRAGRTNHGSYDVKRPVGFYETDLNALREDVLNLTKNEFLHKNTGGQILRPRKTSPMAKKLTFTIPRNIVNEIAETRYINDDVRSYLQE